MNSRTLKPNIVSVCKGTGQRSRHHWVNIQQEATARLTAYPRRELRFKVEEDEEEREEEVEEEREDSSAWPMLSTILHRSLKLE